MKEFVTTAIAFIIVTGILAICTMCAIWLTGSTLPYWKCFIVTAIMELCTVILERAFTNTKDWF